MERQHFPICAHCGDRIGVYEPTIAVGPDHIRRTSLAKEPALLDGEEAFFHTECAQLLRQDIPDQ
jgi:hypothetical protein